MNFVLFLSAFFILGGLAVALNLSSYYGVVGLVMASAVGCGWLVSLGASFMSLVLVVVCWGGMLVVFVYSASLAVGPYPEAWDGWCAVGHGVGLGLVVIVGIVLG